MTRRFIHLAVTPEAHRACKKQAAELGLPMVDHFDNLILGKSTKKKRGDDSFFF